MCNWTDAGILAFAVVLFILIISIYFAYVGRDVQAASNRNNITPQAKTTMDLTRYLKSGDATVSSKFVVDEHFIDPDNNCEDCIRIVYSPSSQQKAGLAYKDTIMNSGNFHRIVFFAKGQSNEKVAFVAAGRDSVSTTAKDKDFFPKINFSIVTDKVMLKKDWQRFEIGIDGNESRSVIYPWGFQITGDSPNKQVIYIKGITLDNKVAQNPLTNIADESNSTYTNSSNKLATASINSSDILTSHIYANTTTEYAPATIGFKAISSGGLVPYSYRWIFHDGSFYIGENLSRTFEKPGLYNVTLHATDSSKPSQNSTATIEVTISSSINKSHIQTLEGREGFLSKSANATNGTNLNTSTGASLGRTGSTNQSALKEVNSTSNSIQRSITHESRDNEAITFRGELKNKSSTYPGKNLATVSDDGGEVSAPNHAPIAINQKFIAYSNKPTKIVLEGIDPDKNSIKFELASSPLKGAIFGFDNERGLATYIPNFNAHGADSFSFKVIDIHNAESNIGIVSSTIVPIPSSVPSENAGIHIGSSRQTSNSAPVASDQTINIDQKKKALVVLRGTDIDDDKLTFSITRDPFHGKIISFNSNTGKLNYLPDEKYVGQDFFTFKAIDEKGLSSKPAKVGVTVNEQAKVNRKIQANLTSDEGSMREEDSSGRVLQSANKNPFVTLGPDRIAYAGESAIILKGSTTDPDGDPLTYSWKQITGPLINLKNTNGAELEINIPIEIRNKVLGFILTVSDGKGGQAVDDIKINILNKNLVNDHFLRDKIGASIKTNQTSQLRP